MVDAQNEHIQLLTKEKEQLQEKLQRVKAAHDQIVIFKAEGGRWSDDVRLLVYKFLTLRVPPESIPECIISTIVAAIPWALEAGLSAPSVSSVRAWREELGVLVRSEAAITLAESDRIMCAGTDATPVNTTELATFNGRVELKGSTLDLLFSGCYEVPDQSGVGEGSMTKTILQRRATELEGVITAYAAAHGEQAALAALPMSANIGLHQLKQGVVITDNASAALAGHRHIAKLIAEAVKDKLGDAIETMSETEIEARQKLRRSRQKDLPLGRWASASQEAQGQRRLRSMRASSTRTLR